MLNNISINWRFSVASTITTYINQIDVNYPIPGQDNNTQGFRSNFSNLKNALSGAAEEITNLQLIADDYAYMALENKPNLFTAQNTFTGTTNLTGPAYFSSTATFYTPAVLPSYTVSQLTNFTSTNTVAGSVVYLLSGYNAVAFFDGTNWRVVTSTAV
jgi:hypothetical protein